MPICLVSRLKIVAYFVDDKQTHTNEREKSKEHASKGRQNGRPNFYGDINEILSLCKIVVTLLTTLVQ